MGGPVQRSVADQRFGASVPVAETCSARPTMDCLVRLVLGPVIPLDSLVILLGRAGVALGLWSLSMKKEKSSGVVALPVLNALAAGVEVGSEKTHVSIAGAEPGVFETFTAGLLALRDYLQEQKVRSVAMAATGVYWLPLYELLERAQMEVVVVNGRHVKNLPGRKTDMQDCQWLATLHAHGLWRGGLVPPAAIRRLRDYQRLRQDHLERGASHIQHMQKALERMNVKGHDVISQLNGVSGQRRGRAILAGERDPERLADLCDGAIVIKKRDRLIESRRGTWRPEHRFALRPALAGWEFYQEQVRRCDTEIARKLRPLAGPEPAPPPGPPTPPARTKRLVANAPPFADLHQLLQRICGGQDVSLVPTLTDDTVLQILSEVGPDLRRGPTPKHFVSWLGLAPGSHQSGKRRKAVRQGVGRAGRLFCLGARSLGQSKHLARTGFYRRIRAVRGGQVAVPARARKVAILFYLTLTKGLKYGEEGLAKYDERFRQQHLARLQRAAHKMGLQLVPTASSKRRVHG
jgi:transposase